MNEGVKREIRKLRQESEIAYITSVNGEGYPQVKGMLVLEHDELDVQYFSTNLSAKRTQQFLCNPKASVYYCNVAEYKGALFTGSMAVCTDERTKRHLWREGFELYYPEGVQDPDYCVLRFTADTVNYYHHLHNETCAVKEL